MKNKWHVGVFFLIMIYDVIYFLAFWRFIDLHGLYRNNYVIWYRIFWGLFLCNIVCQLIAAVIRKKQSAWFLLVMGIIIGFVIHVFTAAQGV